MLFSVLGLLFMASGAHARQAIPLPNAGFENGMGGWTITVDENNIVQATPEAASLGKVGLRVNSDPELGPFEIVSSDVPVEPGTTYVVTFWSGGGGVQPGSDIGVKMYFSDSTGNSLTPAEASIRKWPGVRVSGGRFFNKSTIAAAAPDDAENLSIHILSGKGEAGAVDIDDFKIYALDAGEDWSPKLTAEQPVPPFDPVELAAFLEEIADNPYRNQAPPKVVLKLDDLKAHNGDAHPKWKEVADLAKEKNVTVTFGIIAKGMDDNATEFLAWARDFQSTGLVEYWNHGYDHAAWKADGKSLKEFKGSGYAHQKEHFERSQQLASEYLGAPFTTFGPPFGATDEDTVRVLSETPDITVWLYGKTDDSAGKVILERCWSLNIEAPLFVPNYAAFVEGYAHNRGSEYFVVQGHPSHWSGERWDQFVQIIDFLVEQKVHFVKASEFSDKAVVSAIQ